MNATPPPPPDDLQTRLQRLAARKIVLKKHKASNTRPIVSFTFDDVPITSFTNGARVLDELGAHGTFYIAGGLCTASDRPTFLDGALRSLGVGECAELHARGHEIGCHTFAHRHMRLCSGAEIEAEIERNQAFFNAIDPSIRLENFAFPYNAPTISSKLRLQRHFRSCRGGVPGVNAGTIDLGFLRAVELWSESCDRQIRHWIDEAVRLNGWLILFSHDINEKPGRWGVTPEVLEAAVRYAQLQGCDVASVREALQLVGATAPATENTKD